MKIRVIFLGTPAFSVPGLQALIDAPDVAVIGVLTQPDRPSGRGQKLMPPPIKVLAQAHNIPVFQPVSLKKDLALQDWLQGQQPDFLITIAFGQILNQAVLDIPRYGTVNVHASLLPHYRGANPIQQALIDGCTETGLTTMLTDIGVDTGPMLLKVTTPIDFDETAQEVHDRLSELAGPVLLKTLRGVVDGTVQPKPQDHAQATHAPKATKAQSLIDWHRPAVVLHHQIRGQQPWPGASADVEGPHLPAALNLKIVKTTISLTRKNSLTAHSVGTLTLEEGGLWVQTGKGLLGLLQVQPAGKKPMDGLTWWNGISAESREGLRLIQPSPQSPLQQPSQPTPPTVQRK